MLHPIIGIEEKVESEKGKGVNMLLRFLFIVIIIGQMFSCVTQEKDEYGNVKRNSARELNLTAPDFSFPSHTGDTVNNDFLEGNYYIADFFFTSCPSICPKMSSVVSALQDTFSDFSDIKFVSFTIDPKRDSLPVLKRYAQKYNANPSQWYFLHTEQEEVYELMEKGFFLSGAYNEGQVEEISHSDRLILVSPKGKIVGYYEALEPKLVQELIAQVRVLKSKRND